MGEVYGEVGSKRVYSVMSEVKVTKSNKMVNRIGVYMPLRDRFVFLTLYNYMMQSTARIPEKVPWTGSNRVSDRGRRKKIPYMLIYIFFLTGYVSHELEHIYGM